MTILSEEKIISNKICAQKQCKRPVDFRIKFSLGFSAGFCSRCGEQLIREGLGVKEQKNNAKDEVGEPASISKGTATSENCQRK